MEINNNSIQRYPIENHELNGLRVDVYRNLHRDMWSVRALEGRYKGKVIYNCPEVVLEDCLFVVSEKGRAWVLENKVKKVHAVVRGKLKELILSEEEVNSCEDDLEIFYNPYLTENFIMKQSNEDVEEMIKVKFTDYCKVYKYN